MGNTNHVLDDTIDAKLATDEQRRAESFTIYRELGWSFTTVASRVPTGENPVGETIHEDVDFVMMVRPGGKETTETVVYRDLDYALDLNRIDTVSGQYLMVSHLLRRGWSVRLRYEADSISVQLAKDEQVFETTTSEQSLVPAVLSKMLITALNLTVTYPSLI